MPSLTDDAIAKIRTMIVDGELVPGQRLPPEKELSESLGLSRNGLREAVKALALVRVLDVRQGDGTYVTSLEPALLLESMSFLLSLTHDNSLVELLEVRRILEPAAAALATARATDDDIRRFEVLVGEVDEETTVEDLVTHDLALHAAIADLSGNAYLSGLLEAVSSETVRVRVWRGLTDTGSVRRTLDEHAGIVAAMRRRDPALVAALVASHVEGVERWVRSSLRPAD